VAALIATPVPAPESGDAVALGDVVIGLQRTPCIGTCPSYDLTIHGDGRVVYEGHEYVARTGRIEAGIDTTAVVGLVNRFLSVCFFELPSTCGDVAEVAMRGDSLAYYDSCPSRIERSTTLSLKLGDLEHTVVLRRREPTDLALLAQAIDDAVNIRRWTVACAGPVPLGSAKVLCSPEIHTVHHAAGTLLDVVVLQDGSVAEADIVQGAEPLLDACALDDARRLRFEPAVCNGKRASGVVRLAYALARDRSGVQRVMLPEPLMDPPLISSVADAFRYEDGVAAAYPAYRYGGILVCGDMPIALFESIREQVVETLQPDQSISEIINYLTIQEISGSRAAMGMMGNVSGHVAVRMCTANATWKCRQETVRWFARVGDAFVPDGLIYNIDRD
jgi:hypothetical protein